MRVVIQRVSAASVVVEGVTVGSIQHGLLILLGVTDSDTDEDVEWLAKKIVQLRIFDDENGLMNKSVLDVQGNILLISQFTLFAQTKKGNRPSFIMAAKPDKANKLYEQMKKVLSELMPQAIECGIFGAAMKVQLTNDGPVTIIIDSKNKE